MKILVTLLFCLIASFCFSQRQDTVYIDFGFYKESSISLGMNFGLADSAEKRFNSIEIRFQSQSYGGQHMHFQTKSIGFDVGVNSKRIVFGSKAGGIFSFGPFFAGLDLGLYTDFDKLSLRAIPAIGYGFPYFRISLNPHLALINKDFENLNPFHFSIIFKLVTLKKDKL